MVTRAGGSIQSGGKLSQTDPRLTLGPGSTAKVTQGTDPWTVAVETASTDDLLRLIASDLHALTELLAWYMRHKD